MGRLSSNQFCVVIIDFNVHILTVGAVDPDWFKMKERQQ